MNWIWMCVLKVKSTMCQQVEIITFRRQKWLFWLTVHWSGTSRALVLGGTKCHNNPHFSANLEIFFDIPKYCRVFFITIYITCTVVAKWSGTVRITVSYSYCPISIGHHCIICDMNCCQHFLYCLFETLETLNIEPHRTQSNFPFLCTMHIDSLFLYNKDILFCSCFLSPTPGRQAG